jgi:serine protease AprX
VRVYTATRGAQPPQAITPANSAQTDTFMWNNRDMLITFSAGNEGIDANSNGVIDNDSMGAPATAKNVLTVGASENQRSDNYPCDTGLPTPPVPHKAA